MHGRGVGLEAYRICALRDTYDVLQEYRRFAYNDARELPKPTHAVTLNAFSTCDSQSANLARISRDAGVGT